MEPNLAVAASTCEVASETLIMQTCSLSRDSVSRLAAAQRPGLPEKTSGCMITYVGPIKCQDRFHVFCGRRAFQRVVVTRGYCPSGSFLRSLMFVPCSVSPKNLTAETAATSPPSELSTKSVMLWMPLNLTTRRGNIFSPSRSEASRSISIAAGMLSTSLKSTLTWLVKSLMCLGMNSSVGAWIEKPVSLTFSVKAKWRMS
mmetsp:Transcript_13669/g.38815  ORF Transcript_13669/g.38815 Transcript_13669/m.38815 type:complete len:201 (-) Transcript_13669:257-859(-)